MLWHTSYLWADLLGTIIHTASCRSNASTVKWMPLLEDLEKTAFCAIYQMFHFGQTWASFSFIEQTVIYHKAELWDQDQCKKASFLN